MLLGDRGDKPSRGGRAIHDQGRCHELDVPVPRAIPVDEAHNYIGTWLANSPRMVRARALLSLGILLAIVATAFGSSAAPKKPKKKKPADTTAPAPKDPPAENLEPFNRDAAVGALTSVDLGKCKTPNAARGEGHIAVRFAPNGAALEASVDKGPMLNTPAAKCIAKEFKKQAKVPAFSGDAVLVGKLFKFE